MDAGRIRGEGQCRRDLVSSSLLLLFFFSSLMLGTLLLPLEIPRYRRYMIRYTRTYHTV